MVYRGTADSMRVEYLLKKNGDENDMLDDEMIKGWIPMISLINEYEAWEEIRNECIKKALKSYPTTLNQDLHIL